VVERRAVRRPLRRPLAKTLPRGQRAGDPAAPRSAEATRTSLPSAMASGSFRITRSVAHVPEPISIERPRAVRRHGRRQPRP
jgi:hypothetical protein